MTREERCKNWPAVFTKRGLLRDSYVHKGQAAKMWDVQTKLFKYALVDGYHHMHGTEGALEQLTLPSRTLCSNQASDMGKLQDIFRQGHRILSAAQKETLYRDLKKKSPSHIPIRWLKGRGGNLHG